MSRFVTSRIETAQLSVPQTVARLREFVRFADETRQTVGEPFASRSAVGVVVLTGPRAAGSSTVGFDLARRRWRAGRRTGFLDLQQLGFLTRDGGISSEVGLALRQLATMHDLMTARGAGLLVVSAHLPVADRALVRAALSAAEVTIVRLRADEATYVDHVRARVAGSEARLAADDLLGAGREQQRAVVAAALAEQKILDACAADALVLDVSDRPPEDVVADVARLLSS